MTLILVDAKNALYRFGFAHANLSNGKGYPTGAIYGILGSLVRLKRVYPESHFVFVWDGRGKSWRHERYSGYKSNRMADAKKPDDVKAVLEQQFVVRRIMDLLDIPQLEVPCVEADDLIGMCAIMHRAFGLPVVVYSSDKDFMQLMQAGVQVIRPKPFSDYPKERLKPETAESVLKQFGCKPEDILKVRAYAGDKSDAIPVAIPGIGPKRAMTCLAAGTDPSQDKFVCRDLKLLSRLRTGWPNLRRNYQLMQIAAFADPKLFGVKTVSTIRQSLKTTNQRLEAPVPEPDVMRSRYTEFINALVEYDLYEAIGERHLLWRIQTKTTPLVKMRK